MKQRVASWHVVNKAFRIRSRLKRVVGLILCIWDTDAVRASHLLLIIEIELKGPFFRGFILWDLETVADAYISICVSVIMSRSPSIEVVLGGKVLKLPFWVVCVFVTIQFLQIRSDQIEVEALPSYQFLQVALHHICGLRVFITDDGNNWTLLPWQLETEFLQAVLRDEVKGSQRVILKLIISEILVVTLAGITSVPEKGVCVFLNIVWVYPRAVGWLIGRCAVPFESWEGRSSYLGKTRVVKVFFVNHRPYQNHDEHDKGWAANFKEGTLWLSFPVYEILSHKRLPLAHSLTHLAIFYTNNCGSD